MAIQSTTPGSAMQSITNALAASGGGWQAAAGQAPSAGGGGGSVPSAPADSSAPSGADSLVGKLGLTPTPPTAPMYTSSAQPAMTPRIHVPTMLNSQQNTNRMPLTNQATSIKQARRQNRFAGITNAINSVSNEVQKKKFEDLSTNITNVSRSQAQIASAQQAAQSAMSVLKPGSGASDEQKKAAREALETAQKVITTNQQSMDTILKDDKVRKEMAKAFNVSFTDPSANAKNQDYIKTGQNALEEAKKNEAAGVSHNTPEEKAIADFNKAVENGSYSRQFMNQQPQQMTINPQYEQQYKDYEAKQKYMAQYVLPRVLEGENQRQLAAVNNQSKMNVEHYKQMNENLRKVAELRKDIDVADLNGQKTVQAAQIHAGATIKAAQIRVDGALRLAKDPEVLANKLALKQIKDTTLATLDTSITQETNQLKTQKDLLLQATTEKDKKILGAQIQATNVALLNTQQNRERFLQGLEDATREQLGAAGESGSNGLRTTATPDPSDTKSSTYGKDTDPGGEHDSLIDKIIAEDPNTTAGTD